MNGQRHQARGDERLQTRRLAADPRVGLSVVIISGFSSSSFLGFESWSNSRSESLVRFDSKLVVPARIAARKETYFFS